MSPRNDALFEAHGVSPEHPRDQAVAIGNALLIALGGSRGISKDEMATFVSIATAYGAPPDVIEGWQRFDSAGGKISDHVALEPRLARHLMYEALRICGGGTVSGPGSRVMDIARSLGVDRAVLAPLEAVVNAEEALRGARSTMSENAGTAGPPSAALTALAESEAKLRRMRIAIMETGKPG
jgi:hypothetical protein